MRAEVKTETEERVVAEERRVVTLTMPYEVAQALLELANNVGGHDQEVAARGGYWPTPFRISDELRPRVPNLRGRVLGPLSTALENAGVSRATGEVP